MLALIHQSLMSLYVGSMGAAATVGLCLSGFEVLDFLAPLFW